MRPSTGEGAVHIRAETDRARFAFAGFSDRNGDEHLKACWLTSRHLTSGLDSGDPLEGYCIACGLVQPLAGALGQASATDGREGLKSLELLIALYLSARDGKRIALPLEY